MKPFLVLFLVMAQLAVVAGSNVEVYFASDSGCTDAILRELNKATNQVVALGFFFVDPSITKGFEDSVNRGVKVLHILEQNQRLKAAGPSSFRKTSTMPDQVDSERPVSQKKIMVLDGQTVITGSFNFSKAGKTDNIMIIHDKELAEKYIRNLGADSVPLTFTRGRVYFLTVPIFESSGRTDGMGWSQTFPGDE